MRGIPGSGKSTYVRTHFPDYVICSADHFFEKDGEYNFDPALLGKAHNECYRKFLRAIEDGKSVVVDNTNTTLKEFRRYIKAAMDSGYIIRVIRIPEMDVDTCTERNTHGVPRHAIERMVRRFQDYEGEVIAHS